MDEFKLYPFWLDLNLSYILYILIMSSKKEKKYKRKTNIFFKLLKSF